MHWSITEYKFDCPSHMQDMVLVLIDLSSLFKLSRARLTSGPAEVRVPKLINPLQPIQIVFAMSLYLHLSLCLYNNCVFLSQSNDQIVGQVMSLLNWWPDTDINAW